MRLLAVIVLYAAVVAAAWPLPFDRFLVVVAAAVALLFLAQGGDR